MELKPQLCVFILLIQVSHAVWQHMTVEKGQTVHLRCPISDAHKTNVEWKNPQGYVMFFNDNKALKDKRYSIIKLSETEFTVSISKVTFKDGGNYTCSHYGHRSTTEKKVEITVLGRPRINIAKHEEKFIIKCSAEANRYPPKISFQMDDLPEIFAGEQLQREDKKYVSESALEVTAVKKRVTVKCIVRHPALHSQQLINFVKIGKDELKPRHTTTTSSPTTPTQGSTHGRKTAAFTSPDTSGPSSQSSATLAIVSTKKPETFSSPSNHVTSTDSHPTSNSSTSVGNDSISNDSGTTGWTSVSATTEETTSLNSTKGNTTGDGSWKQIQGEGSSSLLVFLVTCLIFCLLVVVIFFAIKLRRAHILWKRENEESDPSEESSKSKSSQEEKASQAQRRRGLFNTAFTQYVIEEPKVVTSVINAGAMAANESGNKAQASQPQTPGKCQVQNIKETEL